MIKTGANQPALVGVGEEGVEEGVEGVLESVVSVMLASLLRSGVLAIWASSNTHGTNPRERRVLRLPVGGSRWWENCQILSQNATNFSLAVENVPEKTVELTGLGRRKLGGIDTQRAVLGTQFGDLILGNRGLSQVQIPQSG